jgi:uncharacterized cofD-like protein
LFEELTSARLSGEVIPVVLEPANICFKTISGKEYFGENYVDDLRMSFDKIDKIWLKPLVNANKKAIEALKQADLIIVGPGTTYGSVLPNFLPKGMAKAYVKSKAKKVFLVNLFSPANEAKVTSQAGYVDIFAKYLKTKSPFDLVVMADLSKLNQELLKKALYFYELENSALVDLDRKCGHKTMVADIAQIEEKNMRLRHSEEKLAKLFSELNI